MRWTKLKHPEPLERDGVIYGGLRDASFYNHPGHGRRYHVSTPDQRPACNTTSALLVEATLQPVTKIPAYMRCGRPGCRHWWPDLLE